MVNAISQSDCIWSIDQDFKLSSFNAAFLAYKKSLGISVSKGDNIIEKMRISSAEIWKNAYTKALNGESLSFEESLPDKDHIIHYYYISISPIVSNGSATGVMCFRKDITNEKLNKIALKKQSLLLESSIESHQDTIILSLDKDFNYLFFNTAHATAMKHAYNVEVKHGMNIINCITEVSDREEAIKNYNRALNGESHSNIREYGETNKEYYESFFNPIYDHFKKEIIGITCLARNITERYNQKKALKDAIDTKNKFFALISHDLKGFISTSRQAAEIITRNSTNFNSESLKDIANDLSSTLNATHHLLEDLLQWSKSSSNNVSFNPTIINLSEILDKVIHSYDQKIKAKHISIIKDNKGLFPINADEQMISTVIRNLISNAIKFSYELGQINIKFHRTSIDNKEYVLIDIIDNGIGISETQKTKLFNINKNASTLGTNNEKGTGLGLLMCKDFIELHNGDISLNNIPTGGTHVCVKLPQL